MIIGSMKKVKVFFRVLLNSIIPWPSYYSKILHMQFSSSLKYLITLVLLLNIFFIGSIYSKINYNKVHSIISAFLVSTKQIPVDYNLQITNGALLTNYNRPYFFWLDYQGRKELITVVDETATPDKIDKYGSLFLLTSRDLVTQGDLKTIPLSTLGPITINQGLIRETISVFETILKFLPLIYICIIIILTVFMPLFSFAVTVFYLLIASLIGYFTYLIFTKRHVKYKKTVQIAFHAATLPLILDYFIIILRPSLPFKSFIVIPESFFPIIFIFLLSFFIFTGIYEAHEHHKT